ncbi:LLM class F420-dependent oxidoreductase [Novosphingobium sp. BL-52-GroH]|uniref:LLM class F420-dependent oxidoreductase n=1 Tax=Novosphingobium sp. BL-52-GroH TaxID=3349877 RepID=UPI00384CD6CB
MEIGVDLETTADSGHIVELARYVEAAGFDALFFPEHIAVPVNYDTYYRWGNDGKLPEHYNRWPDPYICLAMAAAVTTRLKLGTGISLLPQHDPIRLAKTIATLDFYSGGRTIFAFGAGWLKEEVELFGIDFEERWDRYAESFDALKVMWSEREASYEGKHIRFPALRSEPKPAQPGGPKILVGVHLPKRAFPLVINHADGWFPLVDDVDKFVGQVARLRQESEAAGRDPDTITIYPIVAPHGGDVPLRTMEMMREVGVKSFMMTSDDHGEWNTTGRAKEWIDKVQHLVERAHAVG